MSTPVSTSSVTFTFKSGLRGTRYKRKVISLPIILSWETREEKQNLEEKNELDFRYMEFSVSVIYSHRNRFNRKLNILAWS